ncbi:MAG: hypothetical protein LBL49_08230 [Clostridiales Family XIII bacterium]|nr:hypothetical protein [Clostridiales Family XIII bacterium]
MEARSISVRSMKSDISFLDISIRLMELLLCADCFNAANIGRQCLPI